jgi:homoserine kinase
VRAARIEVDPRIVPVVCVPQVRLATSAARGMLPASVPHKDAAFTAGRAALLIEALSRRPDLLLAATEDRLHQAQRAPAMPQTAELVSWLRAHGVSGAGPAVLVLCASQSDADGVGETVTQLTRKLGERVGHWEVLAADVDSDGAVDLTAATP